MEGQPGSRGYSRRGCLHSRRTESIGCMKHLHMKGVCGSRPMGLATILIVHTIAHPVLLLLSFSGRGNSGRRRRCKTRSRHTHESRPQQSELLSVMGSISAVPRQDREEAHEAGRCCSKSNICVVQDMQISTQNTHAPTHTSTCEAFLQTICKHFWWQKQTKARAQRSVRSDQNPPHNKVGHNQESFSL